MSSQKTMAGYAWCDACGADTTEISWLFCVGCGVLCCRACWCETESKCQQCCECESEVAE